MAGIFSITTPDARLSLTTEGQAHVVFTVTNATTRPQRGVAKVKPLGNTKKEWLKLAGEAERDFSAGAAQQFTVEISQMSLRPPNRKTKG